MPFSALKGQRFRVLAIDPPWHFKSNSKANPGRNAQRHYACMSAAELAALPVGDLAADDCAAFLWITGPMLAIGAHLPLFKAWNFKPSGMAFVWVKLYPRATSLFILKSDLTIGGGFTTRKNCEFVVLGKRGRSVRQNAGVHEVIIEPRRDHSRKPEQFYERVEAYSAGPRLELFARQRRPGWQSWGNEVDKFR